MRHDKPPRVQISIAPLGKGLLNGSRLFWTSPEFHIGLSPLRHRLCDGYLPSSYIILPLHAPSSAYQSPNRIGDLHFTRLHVIPLLLYHIGNSAISRQPVRWALRLDAG